MSATSLRYISIDILRTIAIVMMIVYHILFDLWFMYGVDIQLFEGFWKYWQLITVYLFLGLVGVSFAVSSYKKTIAVVWNRSFKRFGIIFASAILITLVTYMFNPTVYVQFGILHCIAFSVLLLPIFHTRPWSAAIAGLLLISLGLRLPTHVTSAGLLSSILFIPLGIPPINFATLDYFPLLPWSGIIVLGYTVGHVLYNKNGSPRNQTLKTRKYYSTWPGRHSLLLYMVHQPIIIGILHIAM